MKVQSKPFTAPGGRHDEAVLTGWGRTAPSRSRVIRPPDTAGVEKLLAEPAELVGSAARPKLIARGLGRCYGDAAQSAGGLVIDTTHLDHLDLDTKRGVAVVGAGVSLDRLMRESLPKGWFVPVTPGTRQVTVGGAVAADIHGKNHHRDGSFCQHVVELELATPTGTHRLSPSRDPALFWATAGGMGLTGIVTTVTLRTMPVETTWILVDTLRTPDLDTVMAEMSATDDRYHYSVAWVDCMKRGRHLGRAVLTRGDHAPRSALPGAQRAQALSFPQGTLLSVPLVAPRGLLNLATMSAFNEAWYRRAPKERLGYPERLSTFFHPLDGVTDWNRLYGPAGFVQYQMVVPNTAGEAVRRAIEMLSSARVPSTLAVLKRFGPSDPGPLSFPMEGWTLALDMPVGAPQLPRVLDELDDLVAEAGGRVYLAKDGRLRPELLAVMYPHWDELGRQRRRVDPDSVLASDLSTRLGL